MLGLSLALPNIAVLTGGYSAEAQALFARFTTPPTAERKTLINNLIVSLKTAGIWPKLDALYVMAAADNQAARRNWIADSFNLTAVASPTFTADRGYAGDGSTSYLSTGFNPTVGTPLFTQNSANLGSWIRTLSASGAAGSALAARVSLITGGTLFARANAAADDSIGSSVPGHLGWSRLLSTDYKAYRAGSPSPFTRASTALASSVFLICGLPGPTQLSTQQVAAHHWGAGLSDAEELAFTNALTTYMQAVGAA